MAFKVTPPGEQPLWIDAPTREDAAAMAAQMKPFKVTPPGEDPVTIRGASPEDAISRMKAAQQAEPFSLGSAAKEAGAAGLRGVGILAGAPGSLRDAGQRGAKWAIKKLTGQEVQPGGTLDTIMKYSSGPLAGLPNVQEAQQGVNAVVNKLGGGDYMYRQPHNTGEEYIRTGMEFGPTVAAAALTGGTGAVPAAVDLAGSAGLSETLGQIGRRLPELKDNEYVKKYAPWMPGNEDIGRMLGAFGGSTAASKLTTPNKTAMTAEQFVDTAKSKVLAKPIGGAKTPPLSLEEANSQLGSEFQRLTKGHDMPVDNQLVRENADTYNTLFGAIKKKSTAPGLRKIQAELMADQTAGTILGPTYQNYVERLRKLAKSAPTGAEKDAAISLRTSLNDAMERHISNVNPGDLGAFRIARNGYRDTQTLIDAEAAANGGLFTPAQLAAAVKAHAGKKAFVFGKNDLGNLAKTADVKPTDFKFPSNPFYAAALPSAAGGMAAKFFGPAAGASVGIGTGILQGMSRASIEKLLSSPAGKAYRFNKALPPRSVPQGLLGTMLQEPASGEGSKKRYGP